MPSLTLFIWVVLTLLTLFLLLAKLRKNRQSVYYFLPRILVLLFLLWAMREVEQGWSDRSKPLFILYDNSTSMTSWLGEQTSLPLDWKKWPPFFQDLIAREFPDHDPQVLPLFVSENSSPLYESLVRLIEPIHKIPLARALLLSDGYNTGKTTLNHGLSEADYQKKLKDYDLPIDVLVLSKKQHQIPLQVELTQAPTVAFLKTPSLVTLSIQVKQAAHYNIMLTLTDNDHVLNQQSLTLTASETTKTTTLEFSPVNLGIHNFQLKLVAAKTSANGNQNHFEWNKVFSSEVRAKRIKVLHIAGRPSWDVKHLRDIFKALPQLDLISFYILRDPILDYQNIPDYELSLIHFPVQNLFQVELFKFDAIVFHDFDIQRYLMSLNFQKSFQEFLGNGKRIFVIIGDQVVNLNKYNELFVEAGRSKLNFPWRTVWPGGDKTKLAENNTVIPWVNFVNEPAQILKQSLGKIMWQTTYQAGVVGWINQSAQWRWNYSLDEHSLGWRGTSFWYWQALIDSLQPLRRKVFEGFPTSLPKEEVTQTDFVLDLREIPLDQRSLMRLELRDSQTQQVLKQFGNPSQQAEWQISLAPLPAGAYHWRLSCRCEGFVANDYPLWISERSFEEEKTEFNLDVLQKIAEQTQGIVLNAVME